MELSVLRSCTYNFAPPCHFLREQDSVLLWQLFYLNWVRPICPTHRMFLLLIFLIASARISISQYPIVRFKSCGYLKDWEWTHKEKPKLWLEQNRNLAFFSLCSAVVALNSTLRVCPLLAWTTDYAGFRHSVFAYIIHFGVWIRMNEHSLHKQFSLGNGDIASSLVCFPEKPRNDAGYLSMLLFGNLFKRLVKLFVNLHRMSFLLLKCRKSMIFIASLLPHTAA